MLYERVFCRWFKENINFEISNSVTPYDVRVDLALYQDGVWFKVKYFIPICVYTVKLVKKKS